jgi:hypothetical protein
VLWALVAPASIISISGSRGRALGTREFDPVGALLAPTEGFVSAADRSICKGHLVKDGARSTTKIKMHYENNKESNFANLLQILSLLFTNFRLLRLGNTSVLSL